MRWNLKNTLFTFLEGCYPNALKTSIVRPILKKGCKTDPNNYRPISLLPTSSKIFETAMCTKLNSFYEKYKIYNENQHGFENIIVLFLRYTNTHKKYLIYSTKENMS